MPAKRVQFTDDVLAMLLHHIAVEVLTLQNAGRDLDEVSSPPTNRAKDWQQTRHAAIVVDSVSNTASLKFSNPQSEEQILQAIARKHGEVQPRKQEETSDHDHAEPQSTARKGATQNTDGFTIANQLGYFLKDSLAQYPEGAKSWMGMRLIDPQVKLTVRGSYIGHIYAISYTSQSRSSNA